MTPISDIEKLERLLAEATPGPWIECPTIAGDLIPFVASELGEAIADFYPHGAFGGKLNHLLVIALRNLAPSLIEDWKEMRGEIERLTKERDEAYERAAESLIHLHANTTWQLQCDAIDKCVETIRNLKAKEDK